VKVACWGATQHARTHLVVGVQGVGVVGEANEFAAVRRVDDDARPHLPPHNDGIYTNKKKRE